MCVVNAGMNACVTTPRIEIQPFHPVPSLVPSFQSSSKGTLTERQPEFVFMSIGLAAMHVCAPRACSACRGQERASRSLELEPWWLWVVAWLLGLQSASVPTR